MKPNKTCAKCGARNDCRDSKHKSFTKSGKRCCGHCGGVL